MQQYSYKALNLSGNEIEGQETAPSIRDLRARLENKNLILVRATKSNAPKLQLSWKNRVKIDDLAFFNRELTVLLRAGIPVPEALDLLKDRPNQPKLSAILARVLEDLRNGAALSEALAATPEVFDKTYVAMITVGERSGTLVQNLERIQSDFEFHRKISKQVSKAMTYPLFLLFALVCALSFLFLFVLPNFVAMYKDFNAELPWATKLLMGMTSNIHYILFGALFLIGSLIFAHRKIYSWETGQLFIDELALKFPVIGSFKRAQATAQTARILATLLASGMPLSNAISTAAESQQNSSYADKLRAVRDDVNNGNPFHRALARQNLFPEMSLKITEAGEMAGNLDEMLVEVARFHEEELENELTKLMSLIEPTLILFIGILIGGIIIAMYLPIFSITDVIK